MATTNHTANYNLSQYTASDKVKILTNLNQDMAAIDVALKSISDEANASVPNTRKIAGLAMSADITLAQLISAGLASGTNGDADNALKLSGVLASAIIDASGNAQNALKLGGVLASNFPQISSGIWTPILKGSTTAGTPTYKVQAGTWNRIGNWCYINFSVGITAKGGMSGNLLVGGLPFVSAISSAIIVGFFLNASIPDPFYTIGGYISTSSNIINFVEYAKSGAANLSDGNITDTFSLNACSCLYEI